MAPVLSWTTPATLLLLGLGFMSAPPPVSGAPIPHRHKHQHGRFHRHGVAGNKDNPGLKAVPEGYPPTVETPTTRFVDYPVETSYISIKPLPVEVEDIHQAPPTVSFESIADRTRPLVRSSGGGPGSPPYPPNGPVRVGGGIFGALASRARLFVRSSGGGSGGGGEGGVSNSALAFFLAAVGFFFVSLIWNLYVRFGWARDKAKQTDMGAVGAMRLGSLGGEDRGKGRGKAHRSPGGWLRAANATPTPVAAV
ncbi:uncharacterized protein Z520_07573 [Fonsecaea multimorphosa CBS 102226]|uniref:Uncharacterized protein n=1 Tax=Fonsecaea multimorphosa CBS 102226 TaxID=1442371 RepID=A0A0D2KJW0_9EURO|nr:uncharacterized protein Z520_07573 [Fonsecaea multimorphosa CBS 102226]KIX96853.1 hypothetical protein Z520_07573 [Fonsecaea multimorphosa CBS 102226]OAL22532.1 hypothetical protein AYO22_07090 [Fonsecaea multimorphosa]